MQAATNVVPVSNFKQVYIQINAGVYMDLHIYIYIHEVVEEVNVMLHVLYMSN